MALNEQHVLTQLVVVREHVIQIRVRLAPDVGQPNKARVLGQLARRHLALHVHVNHTPSRIRDVAQPTQILVVVRDHDASHVALLTKCKSMRKCCTSVYTRGKREEGRGVYTILCDASHVHYISQPVAQVYILEEREGKGVYTILCDASHVIERRQLLGLLFRPRLTNATRQLQTRNVHGARQS